MGGTSSTHGRSEKCMRYMVGKPEEKVHSGDLGVDVKIIVKYILRK